MVSAIVLEDLCERSDPRFLPELLRSDGPEAGLAKKLAGDARPWSRAQLLAYVDDGCQRPGHRRFVKTLLRAAEAAGDAELLGHLLVAFDALIHDRLVTRTRWLWAEQRQVQVRVLKAATGAPFRSRPHQYKTVKGQSVRVLDKDSRLPGGPTFSIVTRRYLQRRVVRALRALGKHDPARFRLAATTALLSVTDAVTTDPARLLNARGLLELCFHGSAVLVRNSHRFRVAQNRALEELQASPLCAAAWADHEGTADLLRLAATGRSLLVRRFAATLLEGRSIAAEQLVGLVGAPWTDAQLLAARLLERAPNLPTLPARVWLQLLDSAGIHTSDVLAALAAKHLAADALADGELARLCCARTAPVAMLAAARLLARDPSLELLMSALDGEVPAARAVLAERVVLLVEARGDDSHVRDLLDARFADVRARGAHLVTDVRFRDSTAVWGAMSESPFADVRAVLLAHLGTRFGLLPEGSLPRLWATTLLSVHGGGRGKLKALRQLAARVAERPAEADVLLPLVSTALRSTRGPEVKAALAALAQAAVRQPVLAAKIAARFPELVLPRGVEVQA